MQGERWASQVLEMVGIMMAIMADITVDTMMKLTEVRSDEITVEQ